MTQRHTILLTNTGETYACGEQQDVLRAMEALGRRGIPVGCRGGGCGICKVRIREGEYATRKMSRAFVSEAEEQSGVALACRVYPHSNLSMDALDKLALCVNRKLGPARSTPRNTPPNAEDGGTAP